MNILKRVLLIIIGLLIMNIQVSFAGGIDHFEITISPDEAQVGDSVDLTIEAVDKNNVLVEDYDGIIVIFSETDPEAEFPTTLEENTYTFLASDQGKVKFENAVIFKEVGNQEINIYDLDDDTVMGIGEIKISKVEVVENIDINIISPENGLTIGEDSIVISGSSQKNHSIKIIINDTDTIEAVTNNTGVFEKKIENLSNGSNSFKVQVLDAEQNVIGESEEVKIKVDLNIPRIKGIQVTPEEIETESSYEIKLFANNGLTEVSVIINDTLVSLTEDEKEDGTYTANNYSPEEAGNYPIDVIIKDSLGHEVKELGVGNLNVKKVELNSGVEEVVPEVTIVEEVTVVDEVKELKITGLKVIELKSKSIVKWDEIDEAEGYNVYKKTKEGELELIEKVEKAEFEVAFSGSEITYDYFAIKPIGKTSSGKLYEGNLSDATKVKTGPELLILFILSLFIGGMVIVAKRKKA